MATDILPRIPVPFVHVVWSYGGLDAQEMATRITSFSEIAILNNVDDVAGVSSETMPGVGIVRVAFQPGTNIAVALAQVSAISQTILRRMPQGVSPPITVRYEVGSVPILQIALSSDTMSDAQIFDYARMPLRSQIQRIPGIRLSLPYGGASRRIMVDLQPDRLAAYGLSADDVSKAVTSQNLTLPSGVLREGINEVRVSLHGSPATVEEFADLPVRSIQGQTVFLRDVAYVRDGSGTPTNMVRLDGRTAVVVSVMKLGGASTLDIVRGIRTLLPEIRASAPPGMRVELIFDQSVFVAAALASIQKEGLLVGLLVATVVLIFVGSVRSSLIVLTSIPLSLLFSVVVLGATGQTFNLMTLGGLALAIGILVDNALVEIENINRHLGFGKPIRQAILDGAKEVLFPEFVSTLCICIVFVPVFFLTGIVSAVFVPMALAVIAALVASFFLSRTLVPSLAEMLISKAAHPSGWLGRAHGVVEQKMDRARSSYAALLDKLLARPALATMWAGGVIGCAALVFPLLASELFPSVDSGLIRLHARAKAGLQLNATAELFTKLHKAVREVIHPDQLSAVVENIGRPEAVNLAWVPSLMSGPNEGEILVQLRPGGISTAEAIQRIRAAARQVLPEVELFVRSPDILSQTLNAGSNAPIELQISGRDVRGNAQITRDLTAALRDSPALNDVLAREIPDWPQLRINIDRARALQMGVTPSDVASALLSALGSGGSVSPSFWSDGFSSYDVQVEVPPDRLMAPEDLLSLYVTPLGAGAAIQLRSIATIQPRLMPSVISRDTLVPATLLLASPADQDLGRAASAAQKIAETFRPKLKPGNQITMKGQAEAMRVAFQELGGGLLLAIVLIYLVMVVNFQSWRLPLAAMGSLPLALAGGVLGLALTHTPLSIPALMGFIMVLGVSTANSVLVVSFARDLSASGKDFLQSAREAGATRLRPVLMTATAMLLGILPMAAGLGHGGEQNAPLGRVVFGGLLLGTTGTLLLVPCLFLWIQRLRSAASPSGL